MDVETHNSPQPTVSQWLSAMRLRTLPLALASTIAGGFLAQYYGDFNGLVFGLTALTTILLQINSNLANDLGDFQHGTDNEDRIGPMRAMQSGAINYKQMKLAIGVCSGLALISGVFLIWFSPMEIWAKIMLFAMGCLAIWASIKYTAGSSPYGYRGLGDLSVVVFFGLLGVIGSYYVQSATMNWWILLPAISIGALSAAVLNLNNMRDAKADKDAGKLTLAVRLGQGNAMWYHLLLIATGIDSMLVFAFFQFENWYQWLFLLAAPLLIYNTYKAYTLDEPKMLDVLLKPLAITTFLMSILIALGANL